MSNAAEKIKPSIKLSIITLVLSSILVYLGMWQLDRAAYKKNIYAQLQATTNATPLDLKSIPNPSLDKNKFMPIMVDGTFVNNYTFLLDNQMLDHQAGYRVVTPLQVRGLNKWVLIDRGWLPSAQQRHQLPTIQPIYGQQHISGRINTLSSGLVLVKDRVKANPQWPILIQTLDYGLIAQQLNHPVYEFVIQSADTPLQHDGLSSSRHVAYAIQWFVFAVLTWVYFIIMTSVRKYWPLILLSVLFIAPMLAAAYVLLYGDKLNFKTIQHGQLVQPATASKFSQLYTLDGNPLAAQQIANKWQVVYINNQTCQATCQQQKQTLAKLHIALGAQQERVIIATAVEGENGSMLIVNPLGLQVMYYAPQANPSGLLKDLKRLLKYSHAT